MPILITLSLKRRFAIDTGRGLDSSQLLFLRDVVKFSHGVFIISQQAENVIPVLRYATLSERGYILEVNSIELLMEWVAASPIAESGLVTLKDVLLKSSDVVRY